MKLAVLFPGIGYTCDKPLMYYSGKLAMAAGYQIIPVPYGHFPAKVRGDLEKLKICFEMACEQAEALLKDVDFEACDDLLFIGKSIGTAVGGRYAKINGLSPRHALLTPLEETFAYIEGPAVAFHGTADPWARTPAIVEACQSRGIPLHLTEGANHSLETGDVLLDLQTLNAVMTALREWL